MTIEIPFSALIALFAIYGGTLTAFLGTIAYFAFRLGRLPTRTEHNELRNEAKADNVQLREELKADNVQLRDELKADIAQLRTDMNAGFASLREEIRHSHQQIMLALVNHSHREDGQAVFTLPPELETTPAPADN